jgi:hypothetical protein
MPFCFPNCGILKSGRFVGGATLYDFEGRLLPLSITLGLNFPEKFLTLFPEGCDSLFEIEEDFGCVV